MGLRKVWWNFFKSFMPSAFELFCLLSVHQTMWMFSGFEVSRLSGLVSDFLLKMQHSVMISADTYTVEHWIHKRWVCPWWSEPHNVILNHVMPCKWFMLMSVWGWCGGIQQRRKRQETMRGTTGGVDTQFSFTFLLQSFPCSPTLLSVVFFASIRLSSPLRALHLPACLSLFSPLFSVLRRETFVLSWSTGMPTVKEKEDNIYIWITPLLIHNPSSAAYFGNASQHNIEYCTAPALLFPCLLPPLLWSGSPLFKGREVQ